MLSKECHSHRYRCCTSFFLSWTRNLIELILFSLAVVVGLMLSRLAFNTCSCSPIDGKIVTTTSNVEKDDDDDDDDPILS